MNWRFVFLFFSPLGVVPELCPLIDWHLSLWDEFNYFEQNIPKTIGVGALKFSGDDE